MKKNRFLDAPVSESARLERLAAVGQLAGGIAHDFSNLVTAIAFHADYLLNRLSDEPALHERASQIREAARRAGSLTSQLLAVSRRRAVEPRRLDPNATIRDLRSLFHHFLGEDVEIELDLDEGIGHVLIDPSQLEQVILNLAVNARDAMPRGGKLRIASAAFEVAEAGIDIDVDQGVHPGAWVELTVSDSGVGLERGTRDRIFEPFFTTKDSGHGSGLGLSTIARVVRDAGGEVQVESERGRGTTFRVLLPRLEDAESGAPAPATTREQSPPSEDDSTTAASVLVVEDEEELRCLMVEVLEEIGYQVHEAGSGAEAERAIDEMGDAPLDLVLVDLVMPDIRGPELVSKLRRRRDDLQVVYMSGYIDSADSEESREMEGARFIEKPFDGLKLVQTVRAALEEKGG